MCPTRRGSQLKSPGETPVFIDLGLVAIREPDNRTRVRIVTAGDEKGLRNVKKWVASGAIVVVNLSIFSGELSVAEAIIREAENAVEGVARKVGTDAWILVPGNVVVEVPKR